MGGLWYKWLPSGMTPAAVVPLLPKKIRDRVTKLFECGRITFSKGCRIHITKLKFGVCKDPGHSWLVSNTGPPHVPELMSNVFDVEQPIYILATESGASHELRLSDGHRSRVFPTEPTIKSVHKMADLEESPLKLTPGTPCFTELPMVYGDENSETTTLLIIRAVKKNEPPWGDADFKADRKLFRNRKKAHEELLPWKCRWA